MSHHISFDQHPEFFSLVARNGAVQGLGKRREMRELSQDCEEYITGFFAKLPPVDQAIATFYYIHGLSQDQIADLIDVTQAAVSRRLKFIMRRLKSLLAMPSQDPIEVRESLIELFPPDYIEFAFFFYFVFAQNRVKHYINTSQSGAANKLDRVIKYLDAIVSHKRHEDGSYGSLDDREALAMNYLTYFRYTRDKSNIITFLFKGNDRVRAGSLVSGPSVF